MIAAQPLVLAAAVLLLLGVLLSETSSRFGVPSLLLFLFLGMSAGSEGLLGIEFDDFALAKAYGVLALAFILFSGGASTGWGEIRRVLVPGVALASVGVLLSALVLGALASAILGRELLEGMLLGAIIASTDAAAVFSILRSRGVAIRSHLRQLLELESGSNDPAAVFLTVGIISLIQGVGPGPGGLVGLFLVQMGLGVLVGFLLARGAVRLINGLHLARTQDATTGRRGRDGPGPGRGRRRLCDRQPLRVAGLAPGGLHRVIRLLAGRRHLGLPERDLSDAGAGQRPESRQLHALVHERSDFRGVPGPGNPLRRDSLCVLCVDDAPAVRGRADAVSRDEGRDARGHGTQAEARLSAPCR